MSATELTALLLFATAMSFSPGPNTTLSTALAANLGLKHAMRFCLAVPMGWTLLLLATGLGLGALITSVPLLRWRSRCWAWLYAVAGLEAQPNGRLARCRRTARA
jgi:threonine/homoserine/homoserine lactone efflux protein